MKQKIITSDTVEQLRLGSHQAFEQVFTEYFPKIMMFIFSYIKSEEDALELTEELFVELWYKRQILDPDKSFQAFLHTLARNTAINHIRRKKTHENYLNRFEQYENTYTSEDELIAKETALLVEMAIEKMPEKRRHVYILSRKEGMTNEEIAHRLNISKGNVESLLSLALKDIRKAILLGLLLFQQVHGGM